MSRTKLDDQLIAGATVSHHPWLPSWSLVEIRIGSGEMECSAEEARALRAFIDDALRLHDEAERAENQTAGGL